MNDIREVEFDDSPINKAIGEILNAFVVATDKGGNTLFENGTVQEANSSGQDFMSADSSGLCLRIYRMPEQNTQDVYPNYNFRKRITLCIIPFFRFTFVAGETIDGFGAAAVDWYRENLKRMCQKVLENPSLTANLTQLTQGQKQWWNFGKQTEEREAIGNFSMSFDKTIPNKQDWYSCPFWKIIEVDVR